MESRQFKELERLGELRKKLTGGVALEESELEELQHLMGVLLEASKTSRTGKEYDKLVSFVQDIVPLLEYFNEDEHFTRYTLWYCSRLFTESRNLRLRGVEFLSQCKAHLSEVISKMSILYKEKWSEARNETKAKIQTELAKAYSMRALCTQETEPHSKSLMEDIEDAVKFWCLEHTCTMDLSLLYSVYDLLALKGNTHLHSRIYEKMLNCSKLKNDGLKDLCITLWKSRRISHDICGAPICGDFLTRLSNQDESWSRLDSWTSIMEEIHAVGFTHKLAIDINIQQMKKMANGLLETDDSDHNLFVVGHMYYDLAETLIGNGSIIEAIYFAKEAFQLRAKLLKKMFIIRDISFVDNKQFHETFKVRPEVATEVWPHVEGSSNLRNTIITPWNILQNYLESSLLCGHLEENVGEANQYLIGGKNISLMHDLRIFKIRFADALAKHHTKKQSGYNLAKEELTTAEKELNVKDPLISCWKCKNVLIACMKHSTGDVHRYLGHKGASFYKEGVKILKDRQWENKFSTPTEFVGPTNATFCHASGISRPNSKKYDEKCWPWQSIKIGQSGSLETATYLKLEITRRHLLMGLLVSMGMNNFDCFTVILI